MEGGVDHGEGVCHLGHGGLVIHLGQNMPQELVVGLLAHEGDEALSQGGVIVHGLDPVKDVDLFHDLGDGRGMVRGQLSTILPVDLVAVVLGGVVAGGDVEACDAAVLPDSEGQFGGGAHGLEELHGDAVGRHNASGFSCKQIGVHPAVEADGHTLGGLCRTLCQNDLGEGLGGVADHVDVHPAQTQTHDTSETGGAELQHAEEAVFNFGGIIFHGFQFGLFLGGKGGAGQPACIAFLIRHKDSPFIRGHLWYRVPRLI